MKAVSSRAISLSRRPTRRPPRGVRRAPEGQRAARQGGGPRPAGNPDPLLSGTGLQPKRGGRRPVSERSLRETDLSTHRRYHRPPEDAAGSQRQARKPRQYRPLDRPLQPAPHPGSSAIRSRPGAPLRDGFLDDDRLELVQAPERPVWAQRRGRSPQDRRRASQIPLPVYGYLRAPRRR